ncbi:MAG: IS66 family insertion sequence element accessory protein TnpB [Intestinibaculum porci]|uniref:IS66 family insertion sequence element accessory protein TnpB n=1 Tax=Intestinibaculum porci TaxID=2487118 RepID=UPI003F0C55B9
MNFLGDDIKQIFVCTEPVDLRKGIDGYAAIVQSIFHRSPMDHCLYIFCNRSHNKIKALYYDNASTGFWLLYKRLEKGTFKWKISSDGSYAEISEQQFRWLMEGLKINQPTAFKKIERQYV